MTDPVIEELAIIARRAMDFAAQRQEAASEVVRYREQSWRAQASEVCGVVWDDCQ